jgi:hypothetical protein
MSTVGAPTIREMPVDPEEPIKSAPTVIMGQKNGARSI